MRSEQNARKLIERARNAAPYAVNHALLTGLADALEEALREHPEARGVVDGLSWELRQRAKHAGVVTGELLSKAADALDALTAAQQPVQEGGGDVACPYRTTCTCLGACAFGLPGNGAAAPPSAPVGVDDGWEANVRYLLDSYPGSIRVRPGGGREDLIGSLCVTFIKLRDQPLTQQPAQAAPGDARAIIEEFVQCAGVGRPPGKLIAQAQDWLAATPPGDDAAGGAK